VKYPAFVIKARLSRTGKTVLAVSMIGTFVPGLHCNSQDLCPLYLDPVILSHFDLGMIVPFGRQVGGIASMAGDHQLREHVCAAKRG